MTNRVIRLATSLPVLLLLISSFAAAQSTQPDLKGFDGFVEQVMKDWKVPGIAVAIVKDGKIVYAQGYGNRDVKRGLKVTPDTLFAIGSCSKAFTAAALGILVDEKKLEWDKPIRNYLPDLMLADGYATEHIRPRNLVTHQSGLPRHDLVWYGSPLSRNELFARLRHLEPSAPLHAKFQYNIKLLPKDQLGVVVLTNSSSPASGLVANNALDRMLGLSEAPWAQRARDDVAKAKDAQAKAKADDEAKRKKDTKPTLALKEYSGQFEHPAYQTLSFTQDGEQLKGNLHGLPFSLKHYHYDIFQVAEGNLEGSKVTFLMNKTGEIEGVSLALEPNVKEIIFTRKKENNPAVTSK